MAYKYQTINLTSQDFEQGGIDGASGENIEGTNRIRSKEIYPIEGLGYGANNTIVRVTAVTSSGKELNICYELYDSNNGFLKNEGWQSVPGDYIFLNTAKKTRFLIRNTDNTDISPNDLASISLTLKTSYFFIIRDGYPYISDLGNPIEIPSYPSPYAVMTLVANEYPSYSFLEPLEISEPTPYSVMTQRKNEYPIYNYLKTIDTGAFANAKSLRYVRIPESVKKIGKTAFRNTALMSVTIARDCEYYPTSFPDGCVVNFY